MSPIDLVLSQVSFSHRDGVGYLRLEQPSRLNAQTVQMWAEFAEVASIVDQLEPPLRCLVIQGAGRSFCAGIDLSEIASAEGRLHQAGLATKQGDQDPLMDLIAQTQSWFQWLNDLGCVTIAAIQGHALGAGLQLALACDLRILADDAVLGLPEMGYGLVPDLGATEWLPGIVGEGIASDMIFTGRRVDAAEAMRIGLGSRVVPLAELDSEVAKITTTVRVSDPSSIASVKTAMAQRNEPAGGWATIAVGQSASIRSPEVQQRMTLALKGIAGD